MTLFRAGQPLAVAYGMGVDSTAMLVGMAARGIRPDLILFADVGAEKPETYLFEEPMQQWLRSVGFPPIVTVRYEPKDFKNWPPYRTIDQNCLTNGTLVSVAFGFQRKSCTLKWKVSPQNRYTQAWAPAVEAWALGGTVAKLIGFDASPADSRRYANAEGYDDPKYEYRYPLREWGWDRERCKTEIAAAGLPVPVKSACFMCPSSKPIELHMLPRRQLRAIVLMESRAHPRLRNIEGLWGTGCKGARDPSKKKPGKMTDYIREEGLLPAAEIDYLWDHVPKQLVRFQDGFARGEHADDLSAFIRLLDYPGDLPAPAPMVEDGDGETAREFACSLAGVA